MRTRTPLPITAFVLLAVLSGVRVTAQPPPPVPVPAPPPASVPAPASAADLPAAAPAGLADKPAAAPDAAMKGDAAAATKSKDSSGHDTLSVDFPDEDIRNILRNVADLFELNLAMPDALQGKTTIKLRDVTWRQIFTTVLTPVNYTYVEDGNIIKIVSNESLTQEPTSTQVFIINYAKATDILPTISSLVDAAAGGKIVVDGRSNALIITERPTRIERIRPIIETLDRATDQVMIESKFVEVTNRDTKNIGVNWSSLQNYNIGVGKLAGSVDRSRGQTSSDGSNVTTGTTGNNQSGSTSANSNQTSNTQANGASNTGSVTSNNGTPTSTSTTGNNSSLDTNSSTTGNSGTNSTIANTATSALNLLNSIANTGSTNRTLSAVFSADDFNLVLSALQSLNDVKIVSNPTIVTLNNTEATINVGEEDPIPKYSYNQEHGSFEVNGFDYKQIGIILKVTPQVNARGFIKLSLAPTVSQKNGTTTFGGAGGAELPIIAARSAVTQVSLKDGYTMGIGGLLTTQTTKGVIKVPVLGSIPFLGRLFSSDSKDSQVTNLIIFITAKTVSAEGAPIEQVFESSRVRELGMTREDLPGYRDGSTPFVPSAPKPGALNTSESGSAKNLPFAPATSVDSK